MIHNCHIFNELIVFWKIHYILLIPFKKVPLQLLEGHQTEHTNNASGNTNKLVITRDLLK